MFKNILYFFLVVASIQYAYSMEDDGPAEQEKKEEPKIHKKVRFCIPVEQQKWLAERAKKREMERRRAEALEIKASWEREYAYPWLGQ